jgi:hypothetical protein
MIRFGEWPLLRTAFVVAALMATTGLTFTHAAERVDLLLVLAEIDG